MWKLRKGIFVEKIYSHPLQNMLLPNEQKVYRKESRGTKYQLLIDKAILRNCRRTCKGLAMGWIDYKKNYDIVLHSRLKEAVELVRLTYNVNKLLFDSKKGGKHSSQQISKY